MCMWSRVICIVNNCDEEITNTSRPRVAMGIEGKLGHQMGLSIQALGLCKVTSKRGVENLEEREVGTKKGINNQTRSIQRYGPNSHSLTRITLFGRTLKVSLMRIKVNATNALREYTLLG